MRDTVLLLLFQGEKWYVLCNRQELLKEFKFDGVYPLFEAKTIEFHIMYKF